MRHRLIPLLATLLTAPASHGENLFEIYVLATENDPTYRAAAATYQADRQILNQARANLLPTVSAFARRTRNKDRVEAPNVAFTIEGEADFYSNDYTVSLTQPVFDYALIARYRQAKRTRTRADYDFQAAKQDLLLRTAQAYGDALSAGDGVTLAAAERKALSRQLELAKARLEVGLGTVTEQHEARARFETAVAQEVEAANTLADARESLRELTGRLPDQLAVLGEKMTLATPDPPNIDQWVDRALAGNLGIKARRLAAAAAAQEVSAQRAGHLPTLQLIASKSEFESDGSLSGPGRFVSNTDLTLRLAVPIFQGGFVNSKTAEARLRHRAALDELERERRASIRALRAAFLGVTSQTSRVRALAQAVTASESALEGKQKGFEAGLNSNIEVLNAQRDLFSTKRDYLQSRYDFLINQLRLKQAVGTLNEAALGEMNRWLVAPG